MDITDSKLSQLTVGKKIASIKKISKKGLPLSVFDTK